jgi:hypothetical protein
MANELTTSDLSEMELALVRNMVSTPNAPFEHNALAAGYGKGAISSLKFRVTRKPAFIAALHLETARRVQQLAPGALETVQEIERGAIVWNAKVRLDAAKVILSIAGHIAPRARALGEGQDKTLGEMTLDELKETQERLQAELASRAKPVDAQQTGPIDTQPIDLMG